MNKTRLVKWIEERTGDEVCLYDGYESAFIGLARRFDATVAVYDLKKCIACLVRDGMSEDDAIDYFEFNTMGTSAGENTPVFLTSNIYFFGAELLSENAVDIANNIN